MRIIGRKNEQMKIQNALDSNKAEFVVVYGRRRVGKTYLIKEFFNDTFSFYTSGVLSRKMKDELYAFNYSLVSYGCKDRSLPKNWFEAFDKLKTMIEEIDYRCCTTIQIVLCQMNHYESNHRKAFGHIYI